MSPPEPPTLEGCGSGPQGGAGRREGLAPGKEPRYRPSRQTRVDPESRQIHGDATGPGPGNPPDVDLESSRSPPLPMDLLLWFAAGAAAWGVAVGLKVLTSGLLHLATDGLPDLVYSLVQGLNSAVCELGLAALVMALMLPAGDGTRVVAFGLGAAVLEAGLVLLAARADHRSDPQAEGGAGGAVWFALERTAAALGHVGSRGLVWLAVRGPLWPALVALGTFAAVDGAASLGIRREWDWESRSVRLGFYPFVLAVGLAEVLLFAWLLGP